VTDTVLEYRSVLGARDSLLPVVDVWRRESDRRHRVLGSIQELDVSGDCIGTTTCTVPHVVYRMYVPRAHCRIN
jgi:hypothetical protein